MLQKIPLEKINVTKNALFFLSRVPTHHSLLLICDSYKEHKVCLSKTVCGFLQFRFHFVFMKVYITVHQNAWTL